VEEVVVIIVDTVKVVVDTVSSRSSGRRSSRGSS